MILDALEKDALGASLALDTSSEKIAKLSTGAAQ